MERIFFACFFCVYLISCNLILDGSIYPRFELTDTLDYEIVKEGKFYGPCEQPNHIKCTKAQAEYVHLTGGAPEHLLDWANNLIIDQFAPEAEAPHVVLTEFVDDFQTLQAEEGEEFFSGWDYQLRQQVLFNRAGLLSVHQFNMTYTGGAHGNYSNTHLNLDLSRKKALTLGDLIQPENLKEFVRVAELVFRKEYGIPTQGGINAIGFWFADNAFYLPEDFAILEEGLSFRFPTYEVASFADGELEFTVPRKSVFPFLDEESSLFQVYANLP